MDKKRSTALYERYRSCHLCGRDCGIDRLNGNRGFCGETSDLRIATASIHRGEEPPITGHGGSGTVFITGCTLRCSFCQNWQISQNAMGASVATDEFAEICLALQKAGAENVNLVTGTHAIPAIVAGLTVARERGLSIPALWNSSGYEKVESINLAAEQLDVYLPDLKTLDSEISTRYFGAPDYPERATAAILRMVELSPLRLGPCKIAKEAPAEGQGFPDVLESGVVVRHLVLPEHLQSTRAVLRWFADELAGRAMLSLMTQYTPVKRDPSSRVAENLSMPDRFVSTKESDTVLAWLDEFEIEDGFFQELVPSDDWLPDFRRINPFSSELSVPIWHWKTGYAGESPADTVY